MLDKGWFIDNFITKDKTLLASFAYNDFFESSEVHDVGNDVAREDKFYCKPKELGLVATKDVIELLASDEILESRKEVEKIIFYPPREAFNYGVSLIDTMFLKTGMSPISYKVPFIDIKFLFISQLKKNFITCRKDNISSILNEHIPVGYNLIIAEEKCIEGLGTLYLDESLMTLRTRQRNLNTLGFYFNDESITALSIMLSPSFLMSMVKENSTRSVFYGFDVPQPTSFALVNDKPLIEYFPRNWGIWYLPECGHFYVSLYNWKKVEVVPPKDTDDCKHE